MSPPVSSDLPQVPDVSLTPPAGSPAAPAAPKAPPKPDPVCGIDLAQEGGMIIHSVFKPKLHPLFKEYDKKEISDADKTAAKQTEAAADELHKKGDHAAAAEKYLEGFKQNPAALNLLVKRAGSLVQAGKIPDAYTTYSMYLSKNPCDHEVRKQRLDLVPKLQEELAKRAKANEPEVFKFYERILKKKHPELAQKIRENKGDPEALDPKDQQEFQQVLEGLSEKDQYELFFLSQPAQMLAQLSSDANVNQILVKTMRGEQVMKDVQEKLKKVEGAKLEEKKKALKELDQIASEFAAMAGTVQFPHPQDLVFFQRRLIANAVRIFQAAAEFSEKDPALATHAAYYHGMKGATSGRAGEALWYFKDVARQGYLDLGQGSLSQGVQTAKAKLAEIDKLQAEAAQAFMQRDEGTYKEKIEEAKKVTEELPVGLIQAHRMLTTVEEARTKISSGYKKLGKGDEAKGKEGLNDEKIKEIQSRIETLAEENKGESGLYQTFKIGFTVVKDGDSYQVVDPDGAVFQEGNEKLFKIYEVYKKDPEQFKKDYEAKGKEAKELNEFLRSVQYVQSVELSQRNLANRKAMEIWETYAEETKNVESDSGWVTFKDWGRGLLHGVVGIGFFFGDESALQPISDAFVLDLNVMGQVGQKLNLTVKVGQSLNERNEVVPILGTQAPTVQKALELVEKGKDKATSQRASQLMKKDGEGFQLGGLFDYVADPEPKKDKAETLLAAAKAMAEDRPKTAGQIMELIARTAQDEQVKEQAIAMAREHKKKYA